MSKSFLGWHVLYVKSQHEKKVNEQLNNLGLDSFVPIVKTIRQWSDRKKKVTIPLFPSYVFINIHSKKDFYSPLTINGVFSYIRFGECYAKLKNEEIELIQQFIGMEGLSGINVTSTLHLVGKKMEIKHGPLSGLNCTITNLSDNKGRVYVEIESLKQNMTAIIPTYYLI